ncbi:hypothetical protein C4J81_06895 [Deltaproteobacteria bacterium Smac51]|nr:hypothetical protein C4J81_06895 [Deltaproteobacteria bacterium Smac51]
MKQLGLLITNWLLSLICLALLLSIGCEQKKEVPPGPVYPAVHADFTDSQAAQVASRLKSEQLATSYQDGLKLFAESRYREAIECFKPLADQGNSMAAYFIGRSIQFARPADLDSKYSEFAIPEYFLKAAVADNPYAMIYLDKYGAYRSQESTVRWRERAYQYWTVRAQAKDIDAYSSLAYIGADTGNNFARAAYLGDLASILEVVDVTRGDFRIDADISAEYPDWREVVIARLKQQADSGNPIAQFRYYQYTDDMDYLFKAADNGIDIASSYLSRYFHNKGGADNLKKSVFYNIQSRINTPPLPSFQEITKKYRTFEKNFGDGARSEYEMILTEVKKWRVEHPYPYRLIHPLENMQQ